MKILFNRNIWLVICMLAFWSVELQAREIDEIRIIPDTSGYWFVNGKLNLGCVAHYNNGRVRRTTGYLNGNLRWFNILVTCDAGTFDKGLLTLDLQKVKMNGGVVKITATVDGDENIHDQIQITIPAIKKIDLLIPEGYKPRPGTQFWPDIALMYSNGKVYQVNPWKNAQTLSPDSLDIYLGDELIADGLIRVPENLIIADGRCVVSAIWKTNHDIYDVVVLAINYEITHHFVFYAEDGKEGVSGNPGGSDQNGYNGSPGGNGEDAHRVTLFLFQGSEVEDSVIQVYCQSRLKKYEFQMKAGKGKLEIVARGGNGGNGGDGGRGGDATSGSGGYGGYGGNGGDGGTGGKGAEVVIYCDAETEKYLPLILIDNRGGMGGEPGKGGKGGEIDSDGESKSLFEILFPTRNSRGAEGYYGATGPDGGEAAVTILPIEELKTKWILISED